MEMNLIKPKEVSNNQLMSDLVNQEVVLKVEGGAVYKGQTVSGVPCVVINESAMLDMLSHEDKEQGSGITFYLFENKIDRDEYINQRWNRQIRSYSEWIDSE